ncbi:hypothetical protein CWM58_02825 [Klebsiella sp. H-Nf2]|nr:hypothetical protein CWM58_02825 [Klebsiella sp. H-Nf2]
MPVMVMPQKVRMQVIRHGTARKVPCRAEYISISGFSAGASKANVLSARLGREVMYALVPTLSQGATVDR